MKKFSQKLAERYESEIRGFGWDKIQANAYANPQYDENGEVVFQCSLGEVGSVMPSGETPTLWANSLTARDTLRNLCFAETLKRVADEYGMSIVERTNELLATICAGDCIIHLTKQGFWLNGEHICDTDEDLEAWMEQEGNFPDVVHDDGRGSLFYYSVGAN